jgi:hypothetical protein
MQVGLGLYDLAGLDAAGADADALAGASDTRLHWAQVDVPTPASGVICVGDVVSELRPFAAEITLGCHDVAPISIREASKAQGLNDCSIELNGMADTARSSR